VLVKKRRRIAQDRGEPAEGPGQGECGASVAYVGIKDGAAVGAEFLEALG
jgi:hypothetical protein